MSLSYHPYFTAAFVRESVDSMLESARAVDQHPRQVRSQSYLPLLLRTLRRSDLTDALQKFWHVHACSLNLEISNQLSQAISPVSMLLLVPRHIALRVSWCSLRYRAPHLRQFIIWGFPICEKMIYWARCMTILLNSLLNGPDQSIWWSYQLDIPMLFGLLWRMVPSTA